MLSDNRWSVTISAHLDVSSVYELRHRGGRVPPEAAAAPDPDPPLIIFIRTEKVLISLQKLSTAMFDLLLLADLRRGSR